MWIYWFKWLMHNCTEQYYLIQNITSSLLCVKFLFFPSNERQLVQITKVKLKMWYIVTVPQLLSMARTLSVLLFALLRRCLCTYNLQHNFLVPLNHIYNRTNTLIDHNEQIISKSLFKNRKATIGKRLKKRTV